MGRKWLKGKLWNCMGIQQVLCICFEYYLGIWVMGGGFLTVEIAASLTLLPILGTISLPVTALSSLSMRALVLYFVLFCLVVSWRLDLFWKGNGAGVDLGRRGGGRELGGMEGGKKCGQDRREESIFSKKLFQREKINAWVMYSSVPEERGNVQMSETLFDRHNIIKMD